MAVKVVRFVLYSAGNARQDSRSYHGVPRSNFNSTGTVALRPEILKGFQPCRVRFVNSVVRSPCGLLQSTRRSLSSCGLQQSAEDVITNPTNSAQRACSNSAFYSTNPPLPPLRLRLCGADTPWGRKRARSMRGCSAVLSAKYLPAVFFFERAWGSPGGTGSSVFSEGAASAATSDSNPADCRA